MRIKTELSSANIYSLSTSPIAILPSAPAGHAYVVKSVQANVKNGTTAYDTGAIYFTEDGTVANAHACIVIDKAANGFWHGGGYGIHEFATTHIVAGAPLKITVDGAPTVGDGDVDLYVEYDLIEI